MDTEMEREERPQLATVSVAGHVVAVWPEHLNVKVDTTVYWRIVIAGNSPPLRATLYFRDRSPFDWTSLDVLVESPQSGIAVSAKARRKGDYKYGVRVATISGRMIGEDDPYLHVTES